MTDNDAAVTEDELHALVDGELPADRHEAVAAWLAAHPDDAERVAHWRAQAQAIRARYGAVAGEPVPERLKIAAVMRLRRPGWRWTAAAAAAVVAAFLGGGAAGWLARGASASPAAPAAAGGFEMLAQDALTAHKLYSAEMRHPIEVKAGETHLVPWLSRRVGAELKPPDLSALGLRLLGGRLLPGPSGPAALFMYEGASGERFTVYASRTASPESALRFKAEDRAAAFYWVLNQVGYVVSGPADRMRLRTVVNSVYEQTEQAKG